jgi:1-deoxy-D-xylulose-5-phosphate synthase
LGIPDQFIEHGSRSELLADLGLDAVGIAKACRAAIRPKLQPHRTRIDSRQPA